MATYQAPPPFPADEFAFSGHWTIGPRRATAGTGATLALHFQAQDVYLVLGGTRHRQVAVDGKPTRTVTVSGEPGSTPLVSGSSTQPAGR